MRLSRSNTEYLWANFSKENNEVDVNVSIVEDRVPITNRFKYLGFIIDCIWDNTVDVTHRTTEGWLKWKAATGLFCDRSVSLKLKGKFYGVVVRPTLLYGYKCCPLRKVQERWLETQKRICYATFVVLQWQIRYRMISTSIHC